MKNWDEVRTAFQVAQQGTVSGAAEVLGVHHATVIRHIDALEAQLGVKLFQRHARGYTATEAGEDLMRVAQTTDDQFGQLEGRIKGRGADVSGELVVTALGGFAPLVAPILADFQAAHPDLMVRFLTGDRVFRLEYGEAHVAIRAGDGEVQPDNVVQKLAHLPAAMYGADKYIAKYGAPKDEADLVNHRFVGHDNPDSRAPFYRWLKTQVPRENVVFRSSSDRATAAGIRQGAGLGFLPVWDVDPNEPLTQVLAPRDEWAINVRLITHVDLHRTIKVQTFLTFLKERAQDWTSSR
ncbi:LysR family transcriptional regulator [Shimia sagamensis]|uniref:Transcriptional regulator, LysR family n=1 Tax=Shimia sagamensis TaxID=1566352 RepID=A0ABY1P893_9RHOB|nr:LysR family transcriptional regulator [Shimia sagamensis]SMP27095.1 transcriptional regulator, LysR family [Shimia sagamensis]